MAGTLSVSHIQGLATHSSPTTVSVQSGHTLHAPGHIIQVIQGLANSAVFSNSGTYASTGLTATISPKFSSSKILIHVEQQGCASVAMSTGSINMRLQRNSSDIHNFALAYWYSPQANSLRGPISTSYLDSPATTSATVYRTTFAANDGGSCYVQNDNANSVSTITLMEIKQ